MIKNAVQRNFAIFSDQIVDAQSVAQVRGIGTHARASHDDHLNHGNRSSHLWMRHMVSALSRRASTRVIVTLQNV